MKKYVLYPILGIFSLLLLLILVLVSILFFKPTLFINPTNLDYALQKAKILKSYSWSEAEISHEWVKWNKRNIKGHFKNLCFEFENESARLKTCLAEISWDFQLNYEWKIGLKSITNRPIYVRGEFSEISIKDNPEAPKDNTPPDVWRYWSVLWGDLIPDFDFKFLKNELITKGKKFQFDVALVKTPKEMKGESMGVKLIADPNGFLIIAPPRYKVPGNLKFEPPLILHDVKLQGLIKKEIVLLELTGALESLPFQMNSSVDLPLKGDLAGLGFRKKVLLATKGEINVPQVKRAIGRFAPRPFNVLPAPLNSMDGTIKVLITTSDTGKKESVMIKAKTLIDLQGAEQVLLMELGTGLRLNLVTSKPETVLVDVDFKKVNLKLPRISKKSLPPQFTPDSRIKTGLSPQAKKDQGKKPDMDLNLRLEAKEENSLQMASNLLDEPLRVNFDLNIEKGSLKNGFVKSLPLKTTVFKRPIKIPSMQINFNYPIEPVLIGQVVFLLPEYKITMDLEGPLSKPRYAFSSVPALSRNDIYSVLLFGRPMADLDPDDKRAAGQTNQVLAQGIMSLSVLYFLAGSPVEYIGYDPDSKSATAQFRLGSKSSLRVGGDSEGLNSTGIRRSIGKGWYIDTSATGSQKTGTSSSTARDYGVLLEKILAY